MVSRIRSRLTYANVVASLSLFLVLSGGTAVALTGSNTVFSDDIVDGQVKAADLGPASVAGSEVQDNSLTGADVKESTLGRVPQAGNAGSVDGLDSTHFGVGVMGGVMKDVTNTSVAAGTQWAPSGASTASATGPFVAPAGGFVARDLRISLASPNGAGELHTFSLTSPGGALTCTVPENASSCSDSNAVTVGAGQPYSIVETAAIGSARTVDVRFGWRATSP
jgi:hypothetical protein